MHKGYDYAVFSHSEIEDMKFAIIQACWDILYVSMTIGMQLFRYCNL